MQDRDLKHLRADVRELAVKHIALCKAAGIDLLVYTTYRSNADQEAAYAVGRFGDTRKIITCQRGGGSYHNKVDASGAPASLAYDCVGVIFGKPQWDDNVMYLKIGQLAESLGLTWAGRWSGKLQEKCHMQLGV